MTTRRNRKLAKTGRGDGDGKHVRIYRFELNSDAWLEMSCIARCAVMELRRRFDGSNNGHIPFSEREMAERLHVTRKTARKALREATDHGWMRSMVKGAFTLKRRHATEWILANEGYPTPKDTPTRDYMRWTKAPAVKKKDVPKATGSKIGNVIDLPRRRDEN